MKSRIPNRVERGPTNLKARPTRQQILEAVQKFAHEKGRAPWRREVKELFGITQNDIWLHFPNYTQALREAGLEPCKGLECLSDAELLRDWAEVVRQVLGIPTRSQYEWKGRHNTVTLEKRFGSWSDIPARFQQFAEGRREWMDVVALLLKPAAAKSKALPTPEQILKAVQRFAQEKGRAPSSRELKVQSGISNYFVKMHFPNYTQALREAGLEPNKAIVRLENGELLQDWAAVVRKLRRIPTRSQYAREGCHGVTTLEKHFGSWSDIPARFVQFAEGRQEWVDVVALLRESLAGRSGGASGARIDSGPASAVLARAGRAGSRTEM